MGLAICIARADFVRSILQGQDMSTQTRQSPRSQFEQLRSSATSLARLQQFDVSPFVRILEEEGVYDQSTVGNGTAVPPPTEPKLKDKDKPIDRLTNAQKWKQNMITNLHSSPESTISALTHMPIDLPALDLLTTLLQERRLEELSIEPSPVIHQYMQQALRQVEDMTQPLSTNFSESGELPVQDTVGSGNDREREHGRAAQSRAINLLLLFMKNLIRKALIPPEDLYFEISEICVRYMWSKEVRDFRAFIEEGNSN